MLAGVDILVIRELTSGVYFGRPQERRTVDGGRAAVDTMYYHETEVARVAHLGFRLARERRGKLTSVDKANVLESSRLWREVVEEVRPEYPDVECEHILVDAAAMHLIRRPSDFDVVITTNLFGDILTDEASMLAGSLGMLPSASLGELREDGRGLGMYEPIHGSAPDIAGQGVANPVAMFLCVAMLLRHSCGLEAEAAALEAAGRRRHRRRPAHGGHRRVRRAGALHARDGRRDLGAAGRVAPDARQRERSPSSGKYVAKKRWSRVSSESAVAAA